MFLNSEYGYFSAKAVIPYIKDNFGFDLNEDDVEEYVDDLLRQIGNLHVEYYKFRGKVVKAETGNFVDLPCNALSIDSVTTGDDINHTSNTSTADQTSHYIKYNYTETGMHPDGAFIQNWSNKGTRLVFDNYEGSVQIFYRGQLVDDNNIPMVTSMELYALAEFFNFMRNQRRYYTLPPTADLKDKMLMSKAELDGKIDRARVDFKFNQNLVNRYLDIKTSFNRKSFNRDIKLK